MVNIKIDENQMTYKGLTFKFGETLYFKFDQMKEFAKGTISRGNKTQNGAGSFYICSDEIHLNGSSPSNRYGYRYGWVLSVSNDHLHVSRERNLILATKQMINNLNDKIELDNFVNDFFSYNNSPLLLALNTKMKFLEKFYSISESDEKGFVSLKYIKNEKPLEVKVKVSKLINKTINGFNEISDKKIEISEADIEELYTYWITAKETIPFTILRGYEIVNGYNNSNITSCMTNAGEFKLNMYVDNPDKIGLFVFKYNDTVIGRTVVWKADDGNLYHDRVYLDRKYTVFLFRMLLTLKEHKYIAINGSDVKTTVTLNRSRNDIFPYLDSMKIIDKGDKLILATKNY